MALLDAVRRIAPPVVTVVPEAELAWPEVLGRSFAIPVVNPPDLSGDLNLALPKVVETSGLELSAVDTAPYPMLGQPSTISLEALFEQVDIEVIDLLDPLRAPVADGTLFVKKQRQERVRGVTKTISRVEPMWMDERLGRRPKGLSLFELLLPVLMPPAATDFTGDLLFPADLYDYQRAGVKWLFENSAALLADDMGLGKTAQAITAFRALIRRSQALCALVVCPKSVLTNWAREIDRWAPELVAIKVEGGQSTRRLTWSAFLGKCHVLLVTYDTLSRDADLLRGRTFDLVVTDEVQYIKNASSARSRATRNLGARRRWALSGTPLENKLEDLITIFGFVKPGLFQPTEAANPNMLSAQAVKQRVAPFVLRRRKEDALKDLPPLVVDTKWLDLTEAQRKTYDSVLTTGVSRLRARQDVTVQHVFALLAELKQICNFDPATGESAKADFLGDYLEEACSGGQKALVISQYVEDGLKRLQDRLTSEAPEYKPLVYSGGLSSTQRDAVIRAFQTDDSHRVLLLSLKAGGVGLNLTRANYVLHFDRWWNPAVEMQAAARAHRIGQTRTVFETRLVCQDTIEEKIEHILHEKKILFDQVVDDLSDMRLERVLSEEELFGLFGLSPPIRRAPPSREEPVQADGRKALQSATGSSLAGGSRQPPISAVIRAETPFSNRVALRETLRSAEEYLWWSDPHFSARGLEEILATINPAAASEVRILSGPANVNEPAKRDFEHFCAELRPKGITAEWRVLEKYAHDRYIITKHACWNVPPVNSVLAPQNNYSEILPTQNRPPFEEWWQTAKPLAEVQPKAK